MTKIIIETPRELADYYLNREFNARNFLEIQEMAQADLGYIEVQNPSEEYFLNKFLDYNEEYQQKIKKFTDLKKEGNEEIKEEFEVYLEEEQNNNYPMWNTVWEINHCSDYFSPEKLDEIGLGLFEFMDSSYIFVAGAGYDFYEAHWIPLFSKVLPWIKIENDKKVINY